jgi:hypothetical protein
VWGWGVLGLFFGVGVFAFLVNLPTVFPAVIFFMLDYQVVMTYFFSLQVCFTWLVGAFSWGGATLRGGGALRICPTSRIINFEV